ncbi:hypothetical protein I302_100330 [Kwoniella bestiolae CBS 10118]|uniref:Uncharacterized protein n=1 Tax=Kwoniella bestiolae CBS 10118 TaxID=1296100 RepID=A0A1B9G4S0_9TREE|nr:hypothetical protein I302_03702 [Kwoniella bestiolae CBS 10118]OCF26025.1 hypothetical protein I302_03702 [Kwoniella bestiolae CBS 10118]
MPYQLKPHAFSSNDSWHILNPEFSHRKFPSKSYKAFADLTRNYLSNTRSYLSFHHPSRSTPAQRRRVQVYKQPTGDHDDWETDSSGSQCNEEVHLDSEDEGLDPDTKENSIYGFMGLHTHSPPRTVTDTGLLDQAENRPMSGHDHDHWSMPEEKSDAEHSTNSPRGLARPFNWMTSHVHSNTLDRLLVPWSVKRLMHRAFRGNVSR